MDFKPEPNLAEWQISAGEIIDSPRVARYLDRLRSRVAKHAQSMSQEDSSSPEAYDPRVALHEMAAKLLPVQDESMRVYAESWTGVSRMHAEGNLYRQCVDFFKPSQGLLVDLGCGTGGFLAELPFESAIGVDINHYCLQVADSLLTQMGRSAKRYSRTYISFDPDRGFILKPYPVMAEVDLTGTTLLADDIENLHNTMRVLYNQGRKADMVSFTLSGGYTNSSPLQFIDFLNLGDNYWEEKKIKHGQKILDAVIGNVGRICKQGGNFFLAYRLSAFDTKSGVFFDDSDKFGQELARQYPNVDVVRTASIPITQEHGLNGIQIDARMMTPEGPKKIEDKQLATMPYRLQLIDMRIR